MSEENKKTEAVLPTEDSPETQAGKKDSPETAKPAEAAAETKEPPAEKTAEQRAEPQAAAEQPAAEQPAEEKPAEKEAAQEDPRDQELASLRAENEVLKAQVAKLTNEYVRAYADADNTRKRLEKDFEQRDKYKLQSFAKEILPVLDNCERALALKPADGADEAYVRGFQMVYKQLQTALEKEGVEEIDALGKEFDPNWHQAMMTEHVEGTEPGMVLEVLQKGYRLHDRLLRAAMVKVSE